MTIYYQVIESGREVVLCWTHAWSAVLTDDLEYEVDVAVRKYDIFWAELEGMKEDDIPLELKSIYELRFL